MVDTNSVFVPHPPAQPDQMLDWAVRQFRELGTDSVEKERKLIDVLDFLLENLAVAIYGSVRMSAEQAGDDIVNAWQPLDRMDQIAIEGRGLTVAAPGTITFEYEGVYSMQTEISMQHNEAQAGRSLTLRLFNLTTGAPTGLTTTIGVGRNTDETHWTGNLMFEAGPGNTGVELRWEVAAWSGSFTNVLWRSQSISANSVGEWRGPDPLGRT